MKYDVTKEIFLCGMMGVWVGLFSAWLIGDIKCGLANVPEIILRSIMLLVLVGLFIYYLYLTISLINKKLNKCDDIKGDDKK